MVRRLARASGAPVPAPAVSRPPRKRAALAVISLALALPGCGSTPVEHAQPSAPTRPATPFASASASPRACVRPAGVQPIGFSATKYPHIRDHVEDAIRAGYPRVLTLRRDGADTRRQRLLADVPTRHGQDRDEYPPAVGRTRSKADVRYVPSAENRSHGAVLGIKLRRFCDGTRFRYVFY